MTENRQNRDTKELDPESYIQSLLVIIEEQSRLISELREENAQLKTRIAELEAQLNLHSRNSSRPPSMDGFRRPKSQRKKGERPLGGQKGHKSHTLDWVETPDQIKVHTVSFCENCGTSLEQVTPSKVERRQVHDISPLKGLITEHQAEQKTCPCCGQQTMHTFLLKSNLPCSMART